MARVAKQSAGGTLVSARGHALEAGDTVYERVVTGTAERFNPFRVVSANHEVAHVVSPGSSRKRTMRLSLLYIELPEERPSAPKERVERASDVAPAPAQKAAPAGAQAAQPAQDEELVAWLSMGEQLLAGADARLSDMDCAVYVAGAALTEENEAHAERINELELAMDVERQRHDAEAARLRDALEHAEARLAKERARTERMRAMVESVKG